MTHQQAPKAITTDGDQEAPGEEPEPQTSEGLDVSQIVTRPYNHPLDRNFIFDCWNKGVYFGNSWFMQIPLHIFYPNYSLVIERVLKNPNTELRVACFEDSPETLLGFGASNPQAHILHYVHVKYRWRRMGIAKLLVPQGFKTVTHMTELGAKLKPQGVEFNPFAI